MPLGQLQYSTTIQGMFAMGGKKQKKKEQCNSCHTCCYGQWSPVLAVMGFHAESIRVETDQYSIIEKGQ